MNGYDLHHILVAGLSQEPDFSVLQPGLSEMTCEFACHFSN